MKIFSLLVIGLCFYSTSRAQSDSANFIALAEDGSFSLDNLRLTLNFHEHEAASHFDSTYVGLGTRNCSGIWYPPVAPASFRDSVLQIFTPDPTYRGTKNPTKGFKTLIDTSRRLLIGLYCRNQYVFEMSNAQWIYENFIIDTIPYQLDANGLHATLSGAELLHRIHEVSLSVSSFDKGPGTSLVKESVYKEPLDSTCNPSFVFHLHGKISNGITSFQVKGEDLTLFPNPCASELHLVFGTQGINNPQVRIYDALGRTRMQRTTGQVGGMIEVRSLEAGSYLLEVAGMRKMFVVAR